MKINESWEKNDHFIGTIYNNISKFLNLRPNDSMETKHE